MLAQVPHEQKVSIGYFKNVIFLVFTHFGKKVSIYDLYTK